MPYHPNFLWLKLPEEDFIKHLLSLDSCPVLDHHPVLDQIYEDDIVFLTRSGDLTALHNTALVCLALAGLS